MSTLSNLITELCPNGIQYQELGAFTKHETARNSDGHCNVAYSITKQGLMPTDEYFKDAKVTSDDTSGYRLVRNNWFVYSPSRIDVGSINYHRTEEEVIVSPLNVVFSVDETKVMPDYLLEYLCSKEGTWQILTSREGIEGTGRKLLPYDKFAKIKMPLPPLSIQAEIIRVLNKFKALNRELRTELDLRKKQYEYYRERLLSFELEIPCKPLYELCTDVCSGGTPNSKNTAYYGGSIPWLRTQEVDFREITSTGMYITEEGLKNSSAKWIPANSVIVAMYGATVGKVGYTSIPLTTNQACCNLVINKEIAEYKYVFYWLASKYEYIKSLGQGSQTNINAQIVKNLLIPVPSLKQQREIISVLDKFDALCSDLSFGLPAEIGARQQQYEYYRDRLMAFERSQ